MRILIGALLVIISHTLTAGCPKKELYELTYMTKEELIITYCTNISDYDNDKCIYDTWMRLFADTVKVGALGMADAAKNEARQYYDKMICETCVDQSVSGGEFSTVLSLKKFSYAGG